jgi:cytidyltransferase-like protein
MNTKKVFVTGCFDLLHSGHVAFLNEAATYGDVYVGLGSDLTVYNLKGRYPVNNQDERKYMLEALTSVKQCLINTGSGIMDFVNELEQIKADIFIVNEDGNSPTKEELAKMMGIHYIVLKRIPHKDLPVRSTTTLRKECTMPYRIDLAGGWLDQPYVGKFASGSVLTISIEPSVEFNERSGMATSTRRKAIELWQTDIPAGDKEQIAKILFSFENPPGTKTVAGSQDSIGIVFPGLNRLNYSGSYWPEKIISLSDESIFSWIESHLYLITLEPREWDYDVLENTNINEANANLLALAAENCWSSILLKDLKGFGLAFRKSFEAQIKMFPNMVDDEIMNIIEKYKSKAFGWKLSGAGGGGYLILVTEKPIDGAMKIKIRRTTYL